MDKRRPSAYLLRQLDDDRRAPHDQRAKRNKNTVAE